MKPFVKVCESKVLRRSVVVCCGAKAELKRLFFDPKTFDGFAPSPREHRETWRHLEWLPAFQRRPAVRTV